MSGSAANTLWASSFVDELARSGLREVIIAPGSRSTPLVLACAADARLRVRVHLDERSAAFFALGVGKAERRPAAVVTTSGTAVANCLPAVVEASQSGVPLVLLTADRPHRLRGADANQAIDQVGIFGGYVRAFHESAPPSLDGPALRHLRALACRAYAAAVGPDAGPVHVNFPFDKPLEPADAPESFTAAHPLAVSGRPDGAPFVDVRPGLRVLSDEHVETLARLTAIKRGVIVAGPSSRAGELGPAVRRLGAASGWPVLADALSGARFGPCAESSVIPAYDMFLRDREIAAELAPGFVLRVGASPTSAALQEWLVRHQGVPHLVIDEGGRWKDHAAVATDYFLADPVDALHRLSVAITEAGRARPVASASEGEPPEGSESDAWMDTWRRAGAAAVSAIREIGADGGEPHEGDIMAAVLDALPADGALVVSSSMPVRDLDAFGHPRPDPIRVDANRGASGIDGMVSTAFGLASQTDGPTLCVIGDVAFFHDRNGLLWSRERDAQVVFVVVDNDGGGIFHMLPIAEREPEFTRLFATPHGTDPGLAAASHGLAYHDVTADSVRERVASCLEEGASAVLRVRTDRAANHRRRLQVQEAVARSVREALG